MLLEMGKVTDAAPIIMFKTKKRQFKCESKSEQGQKKGTEITTSLFLLQQMLITPLPFTFPTSVHLFTLFHKKPLQ